MPTAQPLTAADLEKTPVVELEPAPSLGQRLQGVAKAPRARTATGKTARPAATPEPAPKSLPASGGLQATALALFADWRFAAWAEPLGGLCGVDLPALEQGNGPLPPVLLTQQRERVQLGQHPAVVSCLTPLADGRTLASGCMDGTVRLWDIGDAGLVGQLELGAAVVSLAAAHDGKLLVAGLQNGSVALVDLPELQLRRLLRGHTAPVTAVTAAGSRRLVATADAEGTVRAWDPVGGGARLSHRAHTGPVSALLASADGATVWSGGWDGSVRAWQPRSGTHTWYTNAHRSVVAALAAGSDWVASGSDDRSVVVHAASSGAELARTDRFASGIKVLTAAHTGHAVAYLTWDGHAGCLRWADRSLPAPQGTNGR